MSDCKAHRRPSPVLDVDNNSAEGISFFRAKLHWERAWDFEYTALTSDVDVMALEDRREWITDIVSVFTQIRFEGERVERVLIVSVTGPDIVLE